MFCVNIGLVGLLIATTIVANQLQTAHGDTCAKIGFSRNIAIPDCVEFPLTTNACRGQCSSFAIPASSFGTRVSDIQSSDGTVLEFYNQWPNMVGGHVREQPILSVGQCCNIIEWVDIEVIVDCINGPRELSFRSAVSCACDHCLKV